jgi:uncharacterized protein YecT (DUF1311 family)
MKRSLAGLALVSLLSTPSLLVCPLARSQHVNEKDSPCANTVSTVEMAECLSKAKDESDAKLNSLYKDIRRKLDVKDAERLTIAQRLWIQYRDANCAAERELYEGGTAAGPVYLACLEGMTRARRKELAVTYAVKLK